MIKTITVFTDGSDCGTTAVSYGVFLAKRLGARLIGTHVLDSRMLEGPLMADISGWLGAQPYSGQLKQFRDLLQQRGQAVLDAFSQTAESEGVEAELKLLMGHPARVILQEEAKTELLVFGRNGEHVEQAGEFIGSTADRVMHRSVKPCLITPCSFRPIRKMLCAFDGSPPASKALHEAVELALALQVPLVIITVAEHHDLAAARDIAEDAMRIARAHECAAANLVVEGRPDQSIALKAEELGCDLIVVGSHGHSKIREMILGSTTHYLIANSRLPVMLVR
ncbi:MAG: universal stress protein [Kiritimatiellae bacterium]|nr:universal stress protein [Kiritimatiellia bacterium]MDW8458663.1 universal stress protein [Verrucomicrobiota bacterium]